MHCVSVPLLSLIWSPQAKSHVLFSGCSCRGSGRCLVHSWLLWLEKPVVYWLIWCVCVCVSLPAYVLYKLSFSCGWRGHREFKNRPKRKGRKSLLDRWDGGSVWFGLTAGGVCGPGDRFCIFPSWCFEVWRKHRTRTPPSSPQTRLHINSHCKKAKKKPTLMFLLRPSD